MVQICKQWQGQVWEWTVALQQSLELYCLYDCGAVSFIYTSVNDKTGSLSVAQAVVTEILLQPSKYRGVQAHTNIPDIN